MTTSARHECPDAELLAAWSEGRVHAADRDLLERHVTACRDCADVIAAMLPADERPLVARVGLPAAAARRLRRTRVALAASVLIATGVLAYAGLDLLARRARDELARRAAVALGQPVAIGRLGIGVARDLGALEIRLHDVRVGADDPLRADDVTLRVPLASLRARAPAVTRVRVVGGLIHLGGGSSTVDGGTRLGGANAVAAALGTTGLDLVDGTLIVDVAGAPPLRIEHLAGTTTPEADQIELVLEGALAGGTVSAEGAVAIDSHGAAAVTIGGRQLAVDALPTSGRLSGLAEISLRITGPVSAPTVNGRVLVRNGRVHGWNPLRDVFAASARDAAASVPALAGDDLAFDELRAAFASQPQGWRISRLYVTTPVLVAGATLEVGAGARLDGTGSMRLPARLGALVAAAPTDTETGTVTLPISIGGTVDAPRITPARAD